MPFLFFPVLIGSALGVLLALRAASRPSSSHAAVACGKACLAWVAFCACGLSLSMYYDYVHWLWAIEYPLVGLLACSGFALVDVERPAGTWFWLGIALLFVGAWPAALIVRAPESFPPGRAPVDLVPALREIVSYGFGGPVPALMIPEHDHQIARGLGHPPRWITVPMAASFAAAAVWIVLVLVALLGSLLRPKWLRRAFFLLTPTTVAIVLRLTAPSLEESAFTNDPILVRSYGPLLAAALVLTALLALPPIWTRVARAVAPDESADAGRADAVQGDSAEEA